MNLLLLGHIFQQKFPERTVQSGEEGKKKKPKSAEHNQKHSPRSTLGKSNNSKTSLLLKVNSEDQRKRQNFNLEIKICVFSVKITLFNHVLKTFLHVNCLLAYLRKDDTLKNAFTPLPVTLEG